MEPDRLYARLGSTQLAGFVRERTGGRALVISGMWCAKTRDPMETCQALVTEVLTQALRRGHGCALFCPVQEFVPGYVRELLALQGFVPAGLTWQDREVLAVDMSRPIVLTRNMDTVLKAPFTGSGAVVTALNTAHRRLQTALTGLYPGCLVLSISASVIHHRLLHMITAVNGVSAQPTQPRVLGECMCVPFGKILRGVAVPNTVTKTLHTDKVYQSDLSSFTIEAYPDYAPLEDQVRTIRAFDRPVILVDDLLHDGNRIRRIAPLLERTGTPIRQVLVGYLTGMGRDLMEELGYPVDSVYYLPNIRLWFVESTLYPFIGGDSIRREQAMAGGLHAAVNMVLPYAAPGLPRDCAPGSDFRLSQCCLANARDILLALETEYRTLYARSLTLSRLGEAVILPLCPDKGGRMSYDVSRAASNYVDNDLELLGRLHWMAGAMEGEKK